MSWVDDVGALPIVETAPRGTGGGPLRSDGLRSAEQWKALRSVQDEVARRGRAGRPVRSLRPLDVRCGPKRHRVAAVFAVPALGSVLVATVGALEDTDRWEVTTTLDVDGDGRPWEVEARRRVQAFQPRAAGDVAILLAGSRGRPEQRVLEVQCRCRTTQLDLDEVEEWLDVGRSQVRLR